VEVVSTCCRLTGLKPAFWLCTLFFVSTANPCCRLLFWFVQFVLSVIWWPFTSFINISHAVLLHGSKKIATNSERRWIHGGRLADTLPWCLLRRIARCGFVLLPPWLTQPLFIQSCRKRSEFITRCIIHASEESRNQPPMIPDCQTAREYAAHFQGYTSCMDEESRETLMLHTTAPSIDGLYVFVQEVIYPFVRKSCKEAIHMFLNYLFELLQCYHLQSIFGRKLLILLATRNSAQLFTVWNTLAEHNLNFLREWRNDSVDLRTGNLFIIFFIIFFIVQFVRQKCYLPISSVKSHSM
jgi:hypothetical protein